MTALRSSMAWSMRPRVRAGSCVQIEAPVVQRQAHRVDRLDDAVVQIHGDPLALLGDGQRLALPVQQRVFDGNGRLHGKEFQRLLVVLGEGRVGWSSASLADWSASAACCVLRDVCTVPTAPDLCFPPHSHHPTSPPSACPSNTNCQTPALWKQSARPKTCACGDDGRDRRLSVGRRRCCRRGSLVLP